MRLQNAARAAVRVEGETGFPAEIQLAAWALATDSGRSERDWMESRTFHESVRFHAKLLQEASIGIEGIDAIAKHLSQWYEGLFERAQERHLLVALENVRRNST